MVWCRMGVRRGHSGDDFAVGDPCVHLYHKHGLCIRLREIIFSADAASDPFVPRHNDPLFISSLLRDSGSLSLKFRVTSLALRSALPSGPLASPATAHFMRSP